MRVDYYNIAGCIVKVMGEASRMKAGMGILAPFAIPPQPEDLTLHMHLVDALDPPAGQLAFSDEGRRVYADGERIIRYHGTLEQGLDGAYLRSERVGQHSYVQVRKSAAVEMIPPKVVLRGMELTHTVTQRNAILLHASHISHNGRAILFTAPSGTGKSTQASLWEKYANAQIINGDRAIVKQEKDGFYAWGVPYSGSSQISKQSCLPLGAIVYLKQAEKNVVRKLTGLEAFKAIWEGCSLDTWSREDVARLTDTVLSAAKQAKIYLLECTAEEEAVRVLKEMLDKEMDA